MEYVPPSSFSSSLQSLLYPSFVICVKIVLNFLVAATTDSSRRGAPAQSGIMEGAMRLQGVATADQRKGNASGIVIVNVNVITQEKELQTVGVEEKGKSPRRGR